MDHEEAVRALVVEKYLLDELTPEEREEFEEHFFECASCAADVKAAFVFSANARAAFEHPAPARNRNRIAAWFGAMRPAYALAAAGVFLVLLAYQSLFRIPRLEAELRQFSAPQAYPAFFLHAAARGDDQAVEASRTARFIGLSVDAPPGQSSPQYVCDLADQSGRTVFSVAVAAPALPGTPLNVLIPGSALQPGHYTLILRSGSGGAEGSELNRYSFNVQLHP
jgi:hypothetical protein